MKWKGGGEIILQLPPEGWRASRVSCIAPATAACTGSHLLHGSAGCMRLTAEESGRAVTTDNRAEALYGIKRDETKLAYMHHNTQDRKLTYFQRVHTT